MIGRFSDWFDALEEPHRFVVFVILIFGWWVPFTLVAILDSSGILPHSTISMVLTLCALCMIAFFYLVMIYRIFCRK